MIRHAALPMIVLGALAGALGGMMGVGGGILLVPLMMRFLGREQHEAQGISLAFVVATAVVAVIPYLHAGRVDVPLASVLAAGAVPGVIAGAATARRTPAARLRRLFGIAVLLTGLRLLAAPPVMSPATWTWPWNAALGAAVGYLAGLLGVGGGTVLVPVLVLAQGLSQHAAQAISLLMIVPVGLVGVWSYARAGRVSPRDAVEKHGLPWLLAGGAAGGLAGGLLAQSVGGPVLSRLFGVLLIAVAVPMMAARSGAASGAASGARPGARSGSDSHPGGIP